MRIPAADRFIAFLAYLPFLPWLMLWPLKLKRNSMFAQFNIRQGAVLSLIFTALAIVSFVFMFFLPVVGFSILFLACAYFVFFALVGMFKVMFGERYRMPLVADVALALKL